MNRKLGAIFATAVLGVTLFPFSALADDESHVGNHSGVHVNYNGTNVLDSSARMKNNRVYASVKAFSSFYGATYTWESSTKTLKINGNTVSKAYGEFQKDDEVIIAPVIAMAEALGNFTSGWDKQSMTSNVTILPKGVVKLGPAVPQMGEHWANPKNMPLGPIFGIYNGKLVFLEVMPDKELNKTVHDIPGTDGLPIPNKVDHFDIDWNPHGHEGDPVPHYDIHEYFISRAEQNQIQ
ncbi:hypothetical protein PP175_13955 [Aneurinibacillus sp. Ricciae_BoGa-3]|uniref:hypothetical protein n=1 Tax=Aneurinibacillus sp. Ricciae_BoGa-3 TaxID=3022697 RepID=UPI0023416990|nr:hypothetical protein [Aneurinibacillus sp. Ricciae_BoGa-3]WCK52542.1 hypothetical protein PP175_13955 [Aneurinibacillus sp. Ricciae_BoGa-3]